MESIDYQERLIALSKAKTLKNNWYLVAETTAALLKDPSGPAQISKKMKDASEASGLGVNTLQRMIAVKEFIDENIAFISGYLPGDINTISFPSLEVVKRLHQVNPEQGRKMLEVVVKGEITYRKLREGYSLAVMENVKDAPARQTVKLQLRNFKEAALDAVRSNTWEFNQNDEITFVIPDSTHIQVDAIAYSATDTLHKTPLAGFEFVLPGNSELQRRNFELLLYRTVFFSSFFSVFWVVFASNTNTNLITVFHETLNSLENSTIGIAKIPWGDDETVTKDLEIIRQPSGTPTPDWRKKFDVLYGLKPAFSDAK